MPERLTRSLRPKSGGSVSTGHTPLASFLILHRVKVMEKLIQPVMEETQQAGQKTAFSYMIIRAYTEDPRLSSSIIKSTFKTHHKNKSLRLRRTRTE